MRRPVRVATALIILSGLVFTTLVWAPPSAVLKLLAPSSVSKCGEGTYTLTVVSSGSEPMQDVEATVTVPTGFDYVTGTTVINYPGGSATDDPTTGDDTLYWDLGSYLEAPGDHIVINEMEINPFNSDPGREWIELYNPTAGVVDISSWRIVAPTQTYIIPFGTTLAPDAYFVHTFSGSAMPNAGTSVVLYDSTGTIIIDQTLTTADTDNNAFSWQRYPNGSDTDNNSDWKYRLSTQGASNGGTSGVLANGDTMTVTFNLSPGCDVPSAGGYRTSAVVRYNGLKQTVQSALFKVIEGNLVVEKAPEVLEATKGDTVTWEVYIQNSGLATLFNVSISDTLRAGLTLLSHDAPAWPNWSYDSLTAGQIDTVTVSAVVNACNQLFNIVVGSWGCGGDTCGTWQSKGSVKYIVQEPYFDYYLNPDPIVVPFCSTATNNQLVVTNTGLGDGDSVGLVLGNIVDPYQISNVSGATYFAANDSFYVGPIPSNDSVVVTFDLGLPYGTCNPPGGGDIFLSIGAVTECREIWFAPTKLGSYQLDASGRASLSASKSGPGSLLSGENGTYTLSVTYDAGSCPTTSVVVTVSDTVPDPFDIIDSGGGSVSGSVITWSNITLNDGVPFVDSITIAHGISDCCGCGQTFTNVLNVTPPISDCCGCTLSAGASQPITIRCEDEAVFVSAKNNNGPVENCTDISYVTTYRFNEIDTLDWSSIEFTEQANNGQTFPGGGLTGPATFVVDSTCSATVNITLGDSLNLAFLTDSCGAMTDSITLDVKYTLYAPNTGTFNDWSVLTIAGDAYGFCCSTDQSYYDYTSVTIGQSDYSIDLNVANKMNTCGTYNFVITVTQNGSYYGYDMRVAYDGTNFQYIGPTVMSGWTDTSGAAITSFEPDTVLGTDSVYWDMGHVDNAGTISFNVIKDCVHDRPTGALLTYIDNCGNPLSDEVNTAPLLLDYGVITIKKTPEIVFANTDTAAWKIYIANKGPGTAFNVMVYDTMDVNLKYHDSLIDGVAKPGSTTVIGPDSQIVIWDLGDMVSQQQRIISFSAELIGCDSTANRATAAWGCLGEECQSVTDNSIVQTIEGRMIIANHNFDPIDQCGSPATFTTEIINIGRARVYNIVATVWLPPGLEYVTGSSSVADSTPTSTDFTGNPLVWRFESSKGWSPKAKSTITFQAQTTDTCTYTEMPDTARVTYDLACKDPGPPFTLTATPQEAEPHLTVSKLPLLYNAEDGDTILWTVKVVSDGDDTARVIRLEDVLPWNTSYLAGLTSPAPDGGDGSGATPLYWLLGDMAPGDADSVILAATLTGCTVDATEDTAQVIWGCCTPQDTVRTTSGVVASFPEMTITQNVFDVWACEGDKNITLINSAGVSAYNIVVTDTLPSGFVYKTGSSTITSDTTHSFTDEPSLAGTPTGSIVIWDSTNIDKIYPYEVINITFEITDDTVSCDTPAPTSDGIKFTWESSCGDPDSAFSSQSVAPLLPQLSITKTPYTQTVNGLALWTVRVSNTGNRVAENVRIEDILGDAFFSISDSPDSTYTDSPAPGFTTLVWVGKTVPIGSNTWTATITADIDSSGDLTNLVSAEGLCSTGCVYSSSVDTAFTSRVIMTKVPDDTLTIGSFVTFEVNAYYWGNGEEYESVIVTDTLPRGLIYLSSSCSTGCALSDSAIVNSTTILTWDLGNFTGPKSYKFLINTVVHDTIANQDGGFIINNVVSTHVDTAGRNFTESDNARIDLREPDLFISKVHDDPDSIVEVGDTLTFTITVGHTGVSRWPAYDVVITDTIPDGLLYVPPTQGAAPPADSQSVTGNFLYWGYDTLTVGDTVVLVYDLTVDSAVIVTDQFVNDAVVTWTSTADTNSFERFGGFTALDDYNRQDDVTLTVDNTASISKYPDTLRTYTIGESLSYTIDIDFPRATLLSVTVYDTLPAGLIYSPGSFSVINETLQVETITPPNDGSSPVEITWEFGTKNNSNNSDMSISFNVIVADTFSLQDGVTVPPNRVTVMWLDVDSTGHSLSDTSGSLLIQEPDLYIDKAHDDADGIVEVGDTLTYTIEIAHTGLSNWTAYDVVITDTIPTGFNFVPATITENPAADSSSLLGNQFYWGYDSLEVGDTMRVGYTVAIDSSVVFNQPFTNYALLSWTSTTGPNPNERFGDNTVLDDYNRQDDVTLTVSTAGSIIKLPDNLRTYTIGESLDYTITIDFAKAVIYDVTVQDSLPQGLIYSTGSFAVTGASLASPQTVVPPNDGSDPVEIEWFFDTVDNADDEDIQITFRAIVADVIGNQDSLKIVPNTAAVYWMDVDSVQYSDADTSGSVLVLEPDLVISKAHDDLDGIVEVGDTLTFSLEIVHSDTSHWTAYNVVITDTIPTGFNLLPDSTMVTPVPDDSSLTGNMFYWAYDSLVIGDTVRISYQTWVDSSAIFNQTLINYALLSWTSTTGPNPNERFGDHTALDDYNREEGVTLTVSTAGSIIKLPDNLRTYTIGESLDYTITIDFAKAVVYDVTVQDTLPQGLIYSTGSFAVTGASLTSPQTVVPPNDGTDAVEITWFFDTVDNSDDEDIQITFRAIVADVIGNQDSLKIVPNTAAVYWMDVDSVQYSDADTSGSVLVLEPDLVISKAHDDLDGIVEVGDTLTFSLEIVHSDTSHWTAYDVVITDTIPTGFNFIPGTNQALPVPDDSSLTGNMFYWAYDSLVVGDTISLSYRAAVDSSAVFNQTLTNYALLSWTSTTGPNANERFGDNTALDDYNREDGVTLTVISEGTMVKLPDNLRTYTIGESLDYTITIDFAVAVVLDVMVQDTLPQGLIYSPGSFSVTGATLASPQTVVPPNDGTDPVEITWDFGTVDNSDNEDIQITFRAIVADVIGNQDSLKIVPNRAAAYWMDVDSVQYSDADTSGSLLLLEPDLIIDKDDDDIDGFVETGDTITYTLVVAHSDTSHWTAHDVVITDTLHFGLNFIPGSRVVTPAPDDSSITGNLFFWAFDSLMVGDTIRIEYKAVVDNSVIISQILVNNARISWTSTTGSNANERFGDETILDDYNREDNEPAEVVIYAVISKEPDTLRIQTVGDTVSYTIDLDFPAAWLSSVTVYDTLPAGLIYDSGSFSVLGETLLVETITPPNDGTEEVEITWEFGTMNNSGNGDMSIAFDAIIAAVPLNQSDRLIPPNRAAVAVVDIDSETHWGADTSGSIQLITPPLIVEKTDSPDPAVPGELLTYTVIYTNRLDEPATNVTLTEFFDPRVSFVSATPPPDIPDSVWQIGTVPPFSADTIEITVLVDVPLPDGISLINEVIIASDFAWDDTTREITQITALPDLEAFKLGRAWADVDSDGIISAGDSLLYIVTLENTGTAPATGVVFSDTPDPNTTLVWGTVTTSQGIIFVGNSPGDASVTVEVGTIPGAGGTAEIRYKVVINDPLPGSVTEILNQGTVTSNELPDEPTDFPRSSADDDPTPVFVGSSIVQFCADQQVIMAKPDTTFQLCLTVDDISHLEGIYSIFISMSFDTTLIWFDSIYTFVNSCLDSSGWHFKWLHPGGDYSKIDIWLIGGGTGDQLLCDSCFVFLEFIVDASAMPGDSTYISFDDIMINEGDPLAIGCDILFIVNRPPAFVTTFDDTTYLIEKHEYCIPVEAIDLDGDSLLMWVEIDSCAAAEGAGFPTDTVSGLGTVIGEFCWTPPKPSPCDTVTANFIVVSTFTTNQPLYDTLTTTFVVYDNLVDVFWPDTVWHACGCIEVPLYIMHNRDYSECLDSLGIMAFDLTLDYDPELLTVFEVGNEGLITEDWGAMQFNVVDGIIYVGMGGNSILSYCDTVPTPIIYVGFCLNENADLGDSAVLSVDHVKLNEGWPTVYWWNGSITVVDLTISGTVTYCDVGIPVPGAEMKISYEWPPATYVDTVYSDSLGFYEITGVPGCTEYCIRPQKHHLPGQVVTSLDASLLLRGLVDIVSLSGCDSLAADVSQDGNISAYDAALLLRSVVCDNCGDDPAPHVGEWIFIPDHRCYDVVDSSLSNQDFVGYIVGDISQNYPGDGPPKIVAGGRTRVSLPQVVGTPGERIVMPIQLEAAEDVFAADILLGFDTELLSLVGVETTTWTSDYLSAYHESEGMVRIGLAGIQGLSGDGAVAEISFDVRPDAREGMDAPFRLEVRLNEDLFPEIVSAGMVTAGRLVPEQYNLAQNYPNPFNPATDIRYQIPDGRSPNQTTVTVYNVLGQEVKTLVDEILEPGFYSVRWDGRDEEGREVASGIYFCRMTAGPFSMTRRMVLLK